jgi:hypothetical protein
MSSRANLIKTRGLYVHGNELALPEGSLKQATNVNIDEDGVITPRRGFSEYGNATNNSETDGDILKQMLEYKQRILRHYQDKLEYEDANGNFQEISGSYSEVVNGVRIKGQEANSNFYFTTSEGIKKISLKSSNDYATDIVTDAGGLKAGYSFGTIVPTVGGFLPPKSKVGYRVLIGTKDSNGNLILGSPSSRFVVTNFSEDVGSSEISTIQITAANINDPTMVQASYFTYTNSTAKYVVYLNNDPDDDPPQTSKTIGATYIRSNIGTTDESAAAFIANSISNSIANVTVEIDSLTPNQINITSTEEGDIVGLEDSENDDAFFVEEVNGSVKQGDSATVKITGVIPEGASTNYFYQIYRTAFIEATEGLTINDIDPGDECNLVFESGFTEDEIENRQFVFTDTAPESFRAANAPLYTNEITGEGILQSNEAPPIAQDIELFRGSTFYANTKSRHRLEFDVISINDFVSDSTKFIIGNDEVTRYYTFVGESEIVDITPGTSGFADTKNGSFILLNSANNERSYYMWFDKSTINYDLVFDPMWTDDDYMMGDRVIFESNIYEASTAITAPADNPSINADWNLIGPLDTLTITNNPFNDGDLVTYGNTDYYVINSVMDNFQLSLTEGGSAETFTGSITTISYKELDPEIQGSASFRIILTGDEDQDGVSALIRSALSDNVDFDVSRAVDQDFNFIDPETPVNVRYLNNGYTKGIRILEDWDSATEYLVDDLVLFSDGNVYKALMDNTNSSPDTMPDPGDWMLESTYAAYIESEIGTGWQIATTQDGRGELSGEYEGGDILLSGLSSVGQSIDETARSLVKIISQDLESPVNAYYLSTSEDLPGQILLEARSLEDKTFYIAIEEESKQDLIGGEFSPTLPESKQIEQLDVGFETTTITITNHGFSNGQQLFISFLDNEVTTGADSFSGIFTISNVNEMAHTFDITRESSVEVSSIDPDFSAVFSADVESDNQEAANRIYFSKINEPEAVPTTNFVNVGPKDEEIVRILALRDNLFVLKQDGIYIVSGTSAPNFSVRLLDNTRIIAADSAVVLNNQIYCLTEQGVTIVTDSGAGIISRPVEPLIDQVTRIPSFSQNTFGISYENDRAYVLFCPTQNADTSATQAYRYNIFERTWSRWEYDATCGIVLERDSTMYLGNADRNYTVQERKTNGRTDHCDRQFDIAINAQGVRGKVLELSTLQNVEVSDVITQTQEVTINYLNKRLLAKMDFFDTGLSLGVAGGQLDQNKGGSNFLCFYTPYPHNLEDGAVYQFEIEETADTWSELITYEVNDKVRYTNLEGKSGIFIAKVSNTNMPPIITEDTNGNIMIENKTIWNFSEERSLQNLEVTVTDANNYQVAYRNETVLITSIKLRKYYERVFSAKPGDNIAQKVENLNFHLYLLSFYSAIGNDTVNEWDSMVTYDPGDKVSLNGVVYESLTTNTGSSPDTENSVDWKDITIITNKDFTNSNVKSLTDTLIDELNLDESIANISSYKKPTTVVYEVYITSKDVTRNQVNVHIERPWIEGAITVFKHFTKTVEWNPQHFGDPSALKQVRYVTIMFDQNNFYDAIAKFASDASQATVSVPFQGKGIGYWADMAWADPNHYWGGVGNDIPFRTIVPRGKQKCRYLSLTFEHNNSREFFKIVGISGVVRPISDRAYR